jgi:hypothetical protein
MIVYTLSEETNIQDIPNVDRINIFSQFFIHPNEERQAEILKCLKFNIENPYITSIYLLNERIYNEDELDTSSNKIIQVDIKRRLKFQDVFDYIYDNNITGYNIIVNSDIFLKNNIRNIYKSDIHINKKMYALLRYEYNVNKPNEDNIFGYRGDSQDTWIIHSNFSISKKESKIFNFEFGKPGCDNKIIYLMSTIGFEIINDPEFIKTYHIHSSNIRNYTSSDRVNKPYELVIPKYFLEKAKNQNMYDVNILYSENYNHKIGNIRLYKYISKKINKNQNFIIPRGSTVETTYAIYGLLLSLKEYNKHNEQIIGFLENNKHIMKNNAGIKVSTIESIKKYSSMYLKAFEQCEIYGTWAPFDAVYRSSSTTYEVLNKLFKNKETFYSEALDIFHYIYSTPWTFALKDKRILIISAFKESIDKKIENRKDIYGIDLFPNCEIITIKPPQTQGNEESEEFYIELTKFTNELDKIVDKYDIALVSCGGYGSLVCSHIYNSGKSAIYIGGVLQMYWGILGTRWFNDRPDIIRLFLNKNWSRPMESEKPKNYENIEGSCYW